MSQRPRILYCHCQYAQVVPSEVKEGVLRHLVASGKPFHAVADLCELSARQDPLLHQLADGAPIKIAACFPRAVKGLFHAAGAGLPRESAEVLNMRVQTVEEIITTLQSEELKPNLPADKTGETVTAVVPASAQET